MIDREECVAEARRWIGTPYRHQASLIGVGADCLGLVRGIWRHLIGREPEQIPAYTVDWSEPSGEEVLFDSALRWLKQKPIGSDDIGEVVLFRMRTNSVAKHVGISAELNGRRTIIHSYTDHGVIETSLSSPWQRKIVGRFDFPKGEK